MPHRLDEHRRQALHLPDLVDDDARRARRRLERVAHRLERRDIDDVPPDAQPFRPPDGREPRRPPVQRHDPEARPTSSV